VHEKKDRRFSGTTRRRFQNRNCWYTPRRFSYEWQIEDLQVTSLYEWQGKDLKYLGFQWLACCSYEWQTKGLEGQGPR
jgi:hypothetical protein